MRQFILHLCGYSAKLKLCRNLCRSGVLRNLQLDGSHQSGAMTTLSSHPMWTSARELLQNIEIKAWAWGPCGEKPSPRILADEPNIANEGIGGRRFRGELWQVIDYVRGWPPPCHPVLGKLCRQQLWCTRWTLPGESRQDGQELQILHLYPPGAKIRCCAGSMELLFWILSGEMDCSLGSSRRSLAEGTDHERGSFWPDIVQELAWSPSWTHASGPGDPCPGKGEDGPQGRASMPSQNPFPWLPRRWVNLLFPWVRWSLMWFYSVTHALRFPLRLALGAPSADPAQALACGWCHSVNIGRGLPKRNVKEALVTPMGLLGDSQTAPYIAVWGGHAGFNKAVMLWSNEVIQSINDTGASFFPGASGEQITLRGVDWSLVKTGVRLSVGDLLLEVTYMKGPCKNMDRYFPSPSDKSKIDPKKNPDSARVFAKVLKPGRVRVSFAFGWQTHCGRVHCSIMPSHCTGGCPPRLPDTFGRLVFDALAECPLHA
eukprot:g31569.t1